MKLVIKFATVTQNFVVVFMMVLKYETERDIERERAKETRERRSEKRNLLLTFYSSEGYQVVPARPSGKGRLEAK